MKSVILIMVIVLLSMLISGFIIYTNLHSQVIKSPVKTTLQANVVKYSDPTYSFSFSYPVKYSLDLLTDKVVITGKDSTRNVTFISSVVSKQTPLLPRQILLNLCHDLVKANCIVDSQSVFININNVTGNSYYFKVASSSALVTESLKGPLYSFSLPLPTGRNGLLFFYPENMDATDQEKDILKNILNTLTIPSPIPLPSMTSSISSHLAPSNKGSSSAK